MNQAEAAEALSCRVGAKEGDTTLSDAEILAILANHKRWATYTAAAAYEVGDTVRVSGSTDNGRIYRCIVPGTSAASGYGPQWPTAVSAFLAQRFADGTGDLMWEDAGPDRIGQYDLAGAESEAWLLKATKVAGAVDSSDSSGLSLKSSQEAAEYRRRANLRQGTWIA